ncbi:hypothetical protein AVEN_247774-1 [Araneus ventricosus]|uniref:Uncharacterized protein n=1 Tax=Araneus ventricosus TaxID=182803 RepID=A0A4Y2VBH9_ARAVE|nr:hypothetical protein AVEN_247774-1 [Araneus ventricosus]
MLSHEVANTHGPNTAMNKKVEQKYPSSDSILRIVSEDSILLYFSQTDFEEAWNSTHSFEFPYVDADDNLDQRTSIMKNASFAVSKEKQNLDSNDSCASSGLIPPVLAGTNSEPMAMRLL